MTLLLLVISLVGAGVAFLFGRRRWAIYIFLVLGIFLAIALWQEQTAAGVLTRYITPYPGFDGATWVPSLPWGTTHNWIFTTREQPSAVAGYYRDPAHRNGWTVEEDSGVHLYLRRGQSCLQISFARDLTILSRGKTTAIFTLYDRCP